MFKLWFTVIPAAIVGLFLSAQTLVEHATAAAGGTAAAAAGKKVSDGIDSVFGRLGSVANEAAGTKDAKNKPRRAIDPAPPIPEVRVLAATPAVAPAAPKPVITPAPPKKVAAPASVVAAKRSLPFVGTVHNLETAMESNSELPVQTTVHLAAQQAALPADKQVQTTSDLASIRPGFSRADVTAKFGKPASRITSSEDGKTVEVYWFRNEAGSIGSVRMVNGQVTDVRPSK